LKAKKRFDNTIFLGILYNKTSTRGFMTIGKLIHKQTGMKLPTFAERFKYKYNTLKKYGLPAHSASKRYPSLAAAHRLAKDLKVSTKKIVEVCGRR